MAKYLFIYRGSSLTPPPSPEAIQKSMEKWGAWIGKFTQSGHMLSPGDGLEMTGRVVGAKGLISDGPHVEAKEVVGGYSIIQADDYETAMKVARECPMMEEEGGTVEIRQLAEYA